MDIVIIILILMVVIGVVAGAVLLSRRSARHIEVDPGEPADSPGGVDVVDRSPVDDEVFSEPGLDEPVVAERPTLRSRLSKARDAFGSALGTTFSRGVDADTWDDLEAALILADVGVHTTTSVLAIVRAEADEKNVTDAAELQSMLIVELKHRLEGFDRTLKRSAQPSVWLFVGVNGVGKTTTIGKLAQRRSQEGESVVLAAGDTFRAAAAEQLGTWAERADSVMIRGAEGSDPSSVIFDAVEHGAAQGSDLVLADTAGRLHNKSNLMEELSKVRRVAEKGAGTVEEVLLVLDATTGQNGLVQARQFTESVEVTGVVLTKLDGSAKGGIVLAIHEELGIPVKLIGVGEQIEDLIDFDPDDFVEAMFGVAR
jgi:fused signal recognition particle receptor